MNDIKIKHGYEELGNNVYSNCVKIIQTLDEGLSDFRKESDLNSIISIQSNFYFSAICKLVKDVVFLVDRIKQNPHTLTDILVIGFNDLIDDYRLYRDTSIELIEETLRKDQWILSNGKIDTNMVSSCLSELKGHGANIDCLCDDNINIISSQATETIESNACLLKNILEYSKVLFGIGENILTSLGTEECGVRTKALKGLIQDYAKENEDRIYFALKQFAETHKNSINERITKEHWYKVLELEKKALKLASCGELSKGDDSYKSLNYDDTIEEMNKNRSVISIFMSICSDEELVDFEKIEKYGISDYLDIDCSNVFLFCELILRHNLIVREVFPELRPKFEAWKMGKEYVEARVAPKESEKNVEKTEMLRSKKAMKYWAKLQKAGWIDENLQPTVSLPKAAIIASVLADTLHLKPRWNAIEKLWNVNNLASQLSRAQQFNYYTPFLKDVENVLK